MITVTFILFDGECLNDLIYLISSHNSGSEHGTSDVKETDRSAQVEIPRVVFRWVPHRERKQDLKPPGDEQSRKRLISERERFLDGVRRK